MSNFSAFVDQAVEVAPRMPLVHTTDWFEFLKFRDTGQMVPENCDVYHEDLLYFFYGRPSFRKHMDSPSVSLSALHLVSLIFEPNSLPAPRRVMPFDTGAFDGGLYDADLHPGMELQHFELDPALPAAAKTVGCFYGDNKSYLRSTIRPDLQFDCDQLEVECFVSIVTALGQSQSDDRKSAIEIQIHGVLDLSSTNILAVILPEQFLDHQPIYDYISGTLGAEPLGYFCPHAKPSGDARVIMHEAARFYRTKGLI